LLTPQIFYQWLGWHNKHQTYIDGDKNPTAQISWWCGYAAC
jgi:hypothetical protein